MNKKVLSKSILASVLHQSILPDRRQQEIQFVDQINYN